MKREHLEQMARERGYTVHEHHLGIYYSSLDRTFDETFLTVNMNLASTDARLRAAY